MATLHPPPVEGGTSTRDQDPPENWPQHEPTPDLQVNNEDTPSYPPTKDSEPPEQSPEQPNPSNPEVPESPNVPSALYEQQQRAYHQQYQNNPSSSAQPSAQPPAPVSSPGCKIFVGGLSWDTDEQSLRTYFEQIGTVLDCVIMRDRNTGHPRGFGFVTFADEEAAGRAASRRHDLDGRQVEAKRAVPRNEGSSTSTPGQPASFPAPPRNQRYGEGPAAPSAHRGHHTTKCKVFVGGLPSGCGVDEFKSYFSRFGEVVDAQVMIDHNTGNSRGFGFVTFAGEATVNAVVGPGKSNTDHEIMGKCVEVKRAEPKGASQDRRQNRDSYNQGGGGARGAAGSGAQNEAIPHSAANGSGSNAAAAAAAAYYSNYPASIAEQYGAYYNNPQWQQYYAAMGYNFNYQQSYDPYQQYLQAYMNTQASANGAPGSSGMPANAGSPNAPAAGGFDNAHGSARYGGTGTHGRDMGHAGPQNGHGSNSGAAGPGSRRSSRRDDRYHPYR